MSTQDDSSKSKKRWEPPSPEELQAALPKYEILSLLGRGGMGAVYKGVQCSINRIVAIKILPPGLDETGDGSFAERFKNEARSMGTLSHPGIVRVFDFGQSFGGILYFVMEFIEGRDVGEWIKEAGRLPPEQALAITAHVCDALQYAHERGIIHRDIKPANIMVGQDGRVRVADFGLAKAAHQNLGLTMSSYIVGTPHYLAPECYLDGPVDSRIDLYALGVTLYAMLTGKVPRGIPEMPSKVVPGLDPRWDEIVSRALKHEPEERYQTAAEMREALDAIASNPLTPPSTPIQKSDSTSSRPATAAPIIRSTSRNLPVRADSGSRSSVSRSSGGSGSARKKGKASRAPSLWGWGIVAAMSIAAIAGGLHWLRDAKTEPTVPPPVSVATQTASRIETEATSTALEETTKDQPFENSLGMKFVPVPGTEVLFCVHETRWKDYAAYAAENPDIDPKWKVQGADGFRVTERQEDHPVAYVSWDDAKAFCEWLSQKDGISYRLPTDREWSISVGIGETETWDATLTPETVIKSSSIFPWGTEWPPPTGAGNYSDESRRAKAPREEDSYLDGFNDGFPTSAPVMNLEPNTLGIWDLGSNVREWCEDWYSGDRKLRTVRGGSWGSSLQRQMLSSARQRFEPTRVLSDLGFRIVIELNEADVEALTKADGVVTAPPDKILSTPETLADRAPNDPTLSLAMKDSPFENSLGMKFVPVPGTDVLFCVHETRYQDYAAYAAENPGIDRTWEDQNHDGFQIEFDSGYHPVTQVNWAEATAFCDWLSRKDGRVYRLAKDREWSIAVGIGDYETWNIDTTPATVFKSQGGFPWGTEWPPPRGAGNYSDESRRDILRSKSQHIEPYFDGFPTTSPVMSFEPNALGLYDLGGNVWEWIDDWHSDEQMQRGLRGASYVHFYEHYIFSSVRGRRAPGDRLPYAGFRVVMELSKIGNSNSGDVSGAASTAPFPGETAAVSTPGPSADHVTEPSRATKDAPFVNSLGMKFVPVPSTSTLFCIHETRWKDYAEYAAEKPGIDSKWRNQIHDGFGIKERANEHPVVYVSWDDAKLFCEWLNEKEGKVYRLPRDREWSHAVGIGDLEKWEAGTTPESVSKPQEMFPWGAWPPSNTSGNYSDNSRKLLAPGGSPTSRYFSFDDGFPTTSPVMGFSPNSLGIFDLGGNVSEWCEDRLSKETEQRTTRGGTWGNNAEPFPLRSSHRGDAHPNFRAPFIGFRIVLEVAGNPNGSGDAHSDPARPSSPSVNIPSPALAEPAKAPEKQDASITPPPLPEDLRKIPALAELERSFNTNLHQGVETPSLEAIANLTRSYVEQGLGRAREAAVGRGDSATVEAIDGELRRVAKGGDELLSGNPGPHPEVARLWETYLTGVRGVEKQRDYAIEQSARIYLTSLRNYWKANPSINSPGQTDALLDFLKKVEVVKVDLTLELEDGADEEISLSIDIYGENRRSLEKRDLGTVRPGTTTLKFDDLPDGSHTITASSKGYAPDYFTFLVKSGAGGLTQKFTILHRLRYTICRVVENTEGGRELAGPATSEKRIVFPSPTRENSYYWRVSQDYVPDLPGTESPRFNFHNINKGCGFIPVTDTTDFDSLNEAPETGYGHGKRGGIPATPGLMMYFCETKLSGAKPRYGKILVEAVTETLPDNISEIVSTTPSTENTMALTVPSAVPAPPATPATKDAMATAVPSAATAPPIMRAMEGANAGEAREFGGIEMVWCPPGKFRMESRARALSDPESHQVTLTEGFWLAKTECTQAQWEAAMGTNPSHFRGANLPVETVSWTDVQEWLLKMNEKQAPPDGWRWVLPTEAQWEYACLAETTERNYSGPDEMIWSSDNSRGKTNPVGLTKANAWGLHDMLGNVWEWCADWYEDYPIRAATDPKGPTTGSFRVNRGGSWNLDRGQCSASYRFQRSVRFKTNEIGFRPAIVKSP